MNLTKKEIQMIDEALVAYGHTLYQMKWGSTFEKLKLDQEEIKVLEDKVSSLRVKLKRVIK